MKELAFIAILAALVAFSAFQAMEIAALKSPAQDSVSPVTGAASQKPAKSSGSGNYNLPSNLENLKTMVGGC
jgi:hypothetical protein